MPNENLRCTLLHKRLWKNRFDLFVV